MLSACVITHATLGVPDSTAFRSYRGTTTKIAMAYVQGNTLEQYLTERGKLRRRTAFATESRFAWPCATPTSRSRFSATWAVESILVTKKAGSVDQRASHRGLGCLPADRCWADVLKHSILGTRADSQTKRRRPKSDLYALGGVLYRMLTGDVPYHVVTEPLPPPRTKVAIIPAALDDLVLKLMSSDPVDRPQDAATVGMAPIELWEKIGAPSRFHLPANPHSTKDLDIDVQYPEDEVDLLWRS